MTSNQPPKEKDGKKRVRFFNVSLRNGIVMSTPAYQDKQSFVAHLIRALETSNPDFAWIQFLFVKSDYGTELVRLKNSIHRTKTAIEQPSVDLISGQQQDRKQLYRDYYRRTDARMKKVDDVVTKPTITMAIQGLWVSGEPDSIKALPFDHCSDEHDSLALFRYRDPRMLIELVNRRMVVDITEYFDRFTKSRMEPPSFLVTQEELVSYIHLPAGEVAKSLDSLTDEESKREFTEGKVEGKEETEGGQSSDISSKLVKLAKVPTTDEALEDAAVQPLSHLAAPTVRTFELVYSGGKTDLLLSAETVEDMRKYAGLLGLVYGTLKLEDSKSRPAFLHDLPAIMGLTGQ